MLIFVTEVLCLNNSLTWITLAYIRYEDIREISSLKDQTVILVKAPPETKLEVPDPLKVRKFFFSHLTKLLWFIFLSHLKKSYVSALHL